MKANKVLKPTGGMVYGVHCGTVDWKGNKLSGCGFKADTESKAIREFWTDAGCGCFSKVALCPRCEPKSTK
jgi:hypothetical protein